MKAFLFGLMFIFTTPAWADWILVNKDKQYGSLYVYMSLDGFHLTSDSSVRYWSLLDMDEKDEYGQLSIRYVDEYDCGRGAERILEFTGFDGQMATGKIMRKSQRASDWRFVAPQTISADIMKTVCETILPQLKK